MSGDAARTLATLLVNTAPLWRPAPFHDDPPWVSSTPALTRALLAFTDAELLTLENDPDALQHCIGNLAPAVAGLQIAAAACLGHPAAAAVLALPETAGRDVPGRKWQQVLHFATACGVPCGPVVEWCSGKGHLGRLLARVHGMPVTGIERDAALCAEGSRLAARAQLDVRFIQADVTRVTASAAQLVPASHAIALHACGDLHVALLRTGSNAGIAAFDIAPCCYHLMRAPHWTPLSQALTATSLAHLALSREDLRLAVQETVTSSPRILRQQRRLAAWRLGFDQLQRELRGVDTYLPTPSYPLRVLADGCAAFCARLATHHGLTLPAGLDFTRLEQAGSARLARIRRLQLLRHACRRPLEVLLVMDRALWLAEQGYAVEVYPFCPRPLTPRNLLIRARRTEPIPIYP